MVVLVVVVRHLWFQGPFNHAFLLLRLRFDAADISVYSVLWFVELWFVLEFSGLRCSDLGPVTLANNCFQIPFYMICSAGRRPRPG